MLVMPAINRRQSVALGIVFLGLLMCACGPTKQPTQRGSLLIIGGGERPDYMIRRIIELAGGDSASILIVPNASSDPVGTAEYQRDQLMEFGVKTVEYVNLTRETVDLDTNLARLDGKTGVFFSGGSQSRLTAILLNSEFLERIRGIYATGGLISGTSAGAAVMSELMITGNELIWDDSSRYFATIQRGNIEVTPGFGFMRNAIIDQHHVRRKRHNRLISLVLEHPDLLGIAIDESTAIIVSPDGTFEVLGEYSVLVYDARNANGISTDKNGNLAGHNLTFSVLKSGERYDMRKGNVTR